MRNVERNPLMDKIGAFILGIVVIILGIGIIINNATQLDEYKSSSDRQTVEAEIKDVHVYTERRSGGRHSSSRTVTKYECTIGYTVNDKPIQYKETYYTEKKVGEKMTLNVYKDKYGDYQIATITSEQDKDGGNLLGYVFIGIGIFICIYGAMIKVETSLR